MTESCNLLGKLARLVIRARWAVVLFWGAVVAVGAFFAPGFVKVTTISFNPPKGSDAAKALDELKRYFPRSADTSQFLGYLEGPDIASHPGLVDFTHRLHEELNRSLPLASFNSYVTLAELLQPLDAFQPGVVKNATRQFVSPDGRAMMLAWSVPGRPVSDSVRMWTVHDLPQIWDSLVHEHLEGPDLSFEGVYSVAQVIEDALETAQQDLEKMDAISLPLAGVVLAIVVGSVRLLLIPLISMVTSLVFTFGLMTEVARVVEVQSISPPLMMSLLIAMSIDYSLFLLTRFREELIAGGAGQERRPVGISMEGVAAEEGAAQCGTGPSPSVPEAPVLLDAAASSSSPHGAAPGGMPLLLTAAGSPPTARGSGPPDVRQVTYAAIERTMQTSGATILLSGLILTASFCFLSAIPSGMISSLGFGCVVTLVILVVVNLTLTPAVLAIAPHFFHRCIEERAYTRCRRKVAAICCRCCGGGSDSRELSPAAPPVLPEKPGWERLAKVTTTWPCNILLLLGVVIFTGGFAWSIPTLHTDDQMEGFTSRGTKLAATSQRVTKHFGAAKVYPFQLILEPLPDQPVAIFSEEFYTRTQGFLKAFETGMLDRMEEAKGTEYTYLTYTSDGRGFTSNITFSLVQLLCFSGVTPPGLTPEQQSAICAYQLQTLTNSVDYKRNSTEPPTATYAIVTAGISPLLAQGRPFLGHARDLCSELGPRFGVGCQIAGIPAYAWDMISQVYAILPLMVVGTFVASLLFLGVAFRSVAIPLRSLVSNGLTLAFVYGAATLVFQYGALEWTHYGGFSSAQKSLNWMLPVVQFFIITGLCLDYDIFLLVRVTEERDKGLEPAAAIRSGLVATGGIITAAGIIMAIAFGGLIFSNILCLNIMGVMMVAATLFDTFVARSVVNPAIMSLLGRWNWWPASK